VVAQRHEGLAGLHGGPAERPKSDVSADIRDHVDRYVTPERPKSDVSADIRDHVDRYVTPERPKSDVSTDIRDHVDRYVTPEGSPEIASKNEVSPGPVASGKDIEAVMRAQRDLVRVVRRLRPVLCYRGA
jgi:hypothetical protein